MNKYELNVQTPRSLSYVKRNIPAVTVDPLQRVRVPGWDADR